MQFLRREVCTRARARPANRLESIARARASISVKYFIYIRYKSERRKREKVYYIHLRRMQG